MKRKLLGLSLLSTVILASCDPADVTPTVPDPTPTPAETSTPTFSSGDGAIVALITRTSTATPIGNMDIDLGTGVAVFGNLSTGAYTNAGTITLNGKTLTRNENNSYVYMPSATDITGIAFDSNIKWVVETPSFTYDAAAGRNMPVASGGIDFSAASLSSSDAFTLKVSGSISNADSVYFQINGPNKSILKRMGGTATSVTFTADEMSSLGKSAGCSMTVAPWNHEQKTLGGKTIHIVNELAISKVVEIK